MNEIAPPELLNVDGVTIVRPGQDYAHLYENMLEHLAIIQQLAVSVTPPHLVVDLRNVKFIGSAFLGQMVAAHKAIANRPNGRFALCGLSSFCRAAISVSKLDKILEICDDVDAAVRQFSRTVAQ